MSVEAAAICLSIPGRQEMEVRATSGPADAFRVRGGVVVALGPLPREPGALPHRLPRDALASTSEPPSSPP